MQGCSLRIDFAIMLIHTSIFYLLKTWNSCNLAFSAPETSPRKFDENPFLNRQINCTKAWPIYSLHIIMKNNISSFSYTPLHSIRIVWNLIMDTIALRFDKWRKDIPLEWSATFYITIKGLCKTQVTMIT